MGDNGRMEIAGWIVDVARSWIRDDFELDPSADLEAQQAQMADLLPQQSDEDGRLRVVVSAPGDVRPSLVVGLGYHRDGGFGADALLVPETGRVFVGGGTRFIRYAQERSRWERQWEREIEVGFWGSTGTTRWWS